MLFNRCFFSARVPSTPLRHRLGVVFINILYLFWNTLRFIEFVFIFRALYADFRRLSVVEGTGLGSSKECFFENLLK